MIPAGKAHNEMLLSIDDENDMADGRADKVPA
jgi:hypothetical protein